MLPDHSALDVYAAAMDRKWPGVLRPSRPRPSDLCTLDVAETQLISAAADRSQNNRRCEATARQSVPKLDVAVIDRTSHHNILDRGAAEIAAIIAG